MTSKALCLFEYNCPADISEFHEICDDDDLVDKFHQGTLTEEDKNLFIENVIVSCECGATLRMEITTNPIDPQTLTGENTFFRLGWDEPDAFEAYTDEQTTNKFFMDWTDSSYGWSLHTMGPYYILASGFSA
jgi:hypothetical protein